jgi:hypothetical protein
MAGSPRRVPDPQIAADIRRRLLNNRFAHAGLSAHRRPDLAIYSACQIGVTSMQIASRRRDLNERSVLLAGVGSKSQRVGGRRPVFVSEDRCPLLRRPSQGVALYFAETTQRFGLLTW